MTKAEQLTFIYCEALTQFRAHAPLVWTRNNFFLLINSGLFAFFGSPAYQSWDGPRTMIPVAGIFLSAIWVAVTVIGRHLQRKWRRLVLEIEKELFAPDQGAFARADTMIGEGRVWFISLNGLLIILSSGFLVGWIIFLILAYFKN
jgi:hypothetical protein